MRAPTPFEKYHTFMRGWRAAAGRKGFDRKHEEHPTLGTYYKAGALVGREAEKAAGIAAANDFDYTPQILRTRGK